MSYFLYLKPQSSSLKLGTVTVSDRQEPFYKIKEKRKLREEFDILLKLRIGQRKSLKNGVS